MATDKQLDAIYNDIDDLLLGGNFQEVDVILSKIPEDAEIDILLAYLTITFAAKSKLKNRAAFYSMVERLHGSDPLLLSGLQ